MKNHNATIYWHADDLGLSQGITQSIQACFDVLNSVSVIVNGVDIDGAVSAVKAYDTTHPESPMRVVLHLNFMEGESLSGKSIICPDGVFKNGFIKFWMHALKNYKDTLAIKDAVYAETMHQIKAFKTHFGYTPKYVDSHQHLHMIPWVAQGVARALQDSSIKYIRIPNDTIWVRSSAINTLKYVLLKGLSWYTHRIWNAHNITPSSAFFGVLPTGTANIDIYKPVLQAYNRQPTQDLEILFHPGKALDTEQILWSERADLWRHYTSPNRDAEAETLRTAYTHIKKT